MKSHNIDPERFSAHLNNHFSFVVDREKYAVFSDYR